MARAMLLTTTALMCLVVAMGCDRSPEVAPEAPEAQGRTVIWMPGRAAEAAKSKLERAAEPNRPMSTPSPDEASEAPSSEPPPPPAKPPRPRAPHTDRCGRPLIT